MDDCEDGCSSISHWDEGWEIECETSSEASGGEETGEGGGGELPADSSGYTWRRLL